MTALLIVIAVALAAGFVAALLLGLPPERPRGIDSTPPPEWPYFDDDSWRLVDERKRAMEIEEPRPLRPRPPPPAADRRHGRSR